MYNSLTGTITQKGPDFICLQTGGVEWKLITSLSTMSALQKGAEARVFTYLQHAETAMVLYGFHNEEERDLFINLIKVDGVGPKAAIKMLGGLAPGAFIAALESGSVEKLTAIPGLGLKTAQKVILALKGKLNTNEPDLTPDADIINALIAMGYERKATTVAVVAARKEVGATGAEADLIRRAMITLSS